VWEIAFFGLKLGLDLEMRAHTPTKNSKEYPPPRVALTLHNFYFTKITDFVVVRRYAKVKRFSLITGSNNIAYFS